MSSLVRIATTETGRVLINLKRVNLVALDGKNIKYTFDSLGKRESEQVTSYVTHETAQKAFDAIHKDMNAYYKRAKVYRKRA